MATFVLLHGAWHGAWCWERLLPPLRERGHESIAVELPIEDPEAGLSEQANAIADRVKQADDETIVVAHSAAGLVAPLLPALRPVRSIVYLTAFLPLAGHSMADQFRASPEPIVLFKGSRAKDELGRSYWPDFESAVTELHPDLSASDARWAFEQLRPQAQLTQVESHPGVLPEVPVTAIACAYDQVVNPEWFRRVSRERLGVDPIELPTGHFPMLTHPEELADTLAAVAKAQVVQRFADGWTRRDFDAVVECIHNTDFAFDWSNSIGPFAGIYEGRDGIEQFWTQLLEAWGDFSPQIEETVDCGPDQLMTAIVLRARGRGSGVPIQARSGILWTLRDGRISRAKLFQTKEEALESARLSRQGT